MYKLVLASNSPRRQKLLQEAGFLFNSFPVNLSEKLENNLKPEEQILSIARQKARWAAQTYKPLDSEDFLILTADTMVVSEGIPLGKPADNPDACRMLLQLSGNSHRVITAVTLCRSPYQEVLSFHVTTEVFFKKLNDTQIQDYLATGQHLDKAGAYGIQGAAGKFVEKIIGDFNNVVGFPILEFEKQLADKNIILQKQKPTVEPLFVVTEKIKSISEKTKIVAVSKLQSTDAIRGLYLQGQLDFAENYVQETVEKLSELSDLPIRWHFIGHLQKNKVKNVVGNFEFIHSVDTVELCKKIDQIAGEKGLYQKIFLQINVAGDPGKSGFNPDNILTDLNQIFSLKNIRVVGLMTMPPLTNSAQQNKKYFMDLRKIRDQIAENHPECQELSMGTTQDFLTAAQCGATFVRLGTILFGQRP